MPTYRRDDESAEIDDVGEIRRRNDARHQRQHAVRRQPDHHAHQAHDQRLPGLDALEHTLAHLRVLTLQRERRKPEERREDDDADDRHLARAREVGDDVGRNERLQQGRDADRRGFADAALQRRAALEFPRALHQAIRAKSERLRDADADRGRDRRRDEQQAQHAGADGAELARVVETRHRRQDRHEHERCDHHLQQADVPAADDGDPRHRAGHRRARRAVDGLGRGAKHDTEPERDQDVGRERRLLPRAPHQPRDHQREHRDVGQHCKAHGSLRWEGVRPGRDAPAFRRQSIPSSR